MILQARDINGPEFVPGILRSAQAAFSETPTLETTYGPPLAGRCGTYRIRVQVNGTLPAYPTLRLSFPQRVQLNDATCGENSGAEPVSRLTFLRIPASVLDLRVDAQLRQATVQIDAGNTRSDGWPRPGYIEFYLTNVRHTSSGPPGFMAIEALFPEAILQPDRLVEHDRSVPLLAVVSPPPQFASVTPAVLTAGSRTSLRVRLTISGRLPRSGIVEVILPAAFRINDGDGTAVIASTLNGQSATTRVLSTDIATGSVKVRATRVLITSK